MAEAGELKTMNKTLALIVGSFMLLGLVGVVAQDSVITASSEPAQPQQYTQSGEIYVNQITSGMLVPKGTLIKETTTERLGREYRDASKIVLWSKEGRMWDVTTNKFVNFPEFYENHPGTRYTTNNIEQVDGHFKLVGFDYSSIPSDVKLYNLV